MRRSLNGTPEIRVDEYTPARDTAAVPWMSSLKQSTRSRYFFEQRVRVRRQEILELDEGVRKARLHGLDELVHQTEIRAAFEAPARVAEIERVLPQLLVVRADVEGHRQAGLRIDSRAGGVERELAHQGCPCRWRRDRRGPGCAVRR